MLCNESYVNTQSATNLWWQKMQRRWNVFLLLITTLMTTCEPYLEKSSKHSTKIYLLFSGISYNSYFRKYHKIQYQWFQRRHSLWGSTSGNLEAASQRLLQKETLPQFFFEFGKCFQSRYKEQILVNSSENIK